MTHEVKIFSDNFGNKLQLSFEIILHRYSDSTTKVIQNHNVLDINLGKEPMMTFWPVWHYRVPGEKCILCKLFLFRVWAEFDEVSSQNDMGTARIFWIKLIFGTIITLKISMSVKRLYDLSTVLI